MKRSFLILGVLLQVVASSQFRTGVSAFYGRSIVATNRVDEIKGESYKTEFGNNFLGGIYFNYGVNDWFAIQVDVMYDRINTFEGFYKVVYEEDFLTPPPSVSSWPLRWFEEELWLRMDYLSFPLSAEFKVKKWKFKIGGQYSFLSKIGASAHHYSYYFNYDYGSEFEYIEGFWVYNRHNFSGFINCSYNLFQNLFLEVRYTHGFLNLNQDYIDHKSWSRQLNFGLSYQILPQNSKTKKQIEELPIEN